MKFSVKYAPQTLGEVVYGQLEGCYGLRARPGVLDFVHKQDRQNQRVREIPIRGVGL